MSKSISEQSCTKLAAARKEFGLLLLTLLLLLQKKLHRRRPSITPHSRCWCGPSSLAASKLDAGDAGGRQR
jgi:hypothetical protein